MKASKYTFILSRDAQFVYGGERIASHDLRRLLQDETYRDLLPPDKVYDLIDLVDFNPGKAISYMEFVKIVSISSSLSNLFSSLFCTY